MVLMLVLSTFSGLHSLVSLSLVPCSRRMTILGIWTTTLVTGVLAMTISSIPAVLLVPRVLVLRSALYLAILPDCTRRINVLSVLVLITVAAIGLTIKFSLRRQK